MILLIKYKLYNNINPKENKIHYDKLQTNQGQNQKNNKKQFANKKRKKTNYFIDNV